MYLVHKDERGSFQELAHFSDVIFGQLSLLTVNPGCERGGHYHKRKEEWFCCIRGRCSMGIKHIPSGASRVVVMDEGKKCLVPIKPYESHTVANFSDSEVCELLVIVSEEYKPEDSDTYMVG